MCSHETKYAKGLCYTCYQAQYGRKRRERRRLEGLCIFCGIEMDREGTMCSKCCDFKKIKQRARKTG